MERFFLQILSVSTVSTVSGVSGVSPVLNVSTVAFSSSNFEAKPLSVATVSGVSYIVFVESRKVVPNRFRQSLRKSYLVSLANAMIFFRRRT